MAKIHSPISTAELRDCICDHIIAEQTLDVRTNGSLTGLGMPMTTDGVLSLKGLNKILSYEPEELVISLQPGVKLSDLKELLGNHNQELKFEPPDYGPLYGVEKDSGSIGGIIGTNLSGPKRFMAGAARDYVLGVQGVSGFGKIFKAGGKVVKNVSGYDVSKLITGSMGTLGAISEFTLKLSPKAETEITVCVNNLPDLEAMVMMSRLAGSPYEVSGLAHFPQMPHFPRMPHFPQMKDKQATTYIRIEGVKSSIDERKDAILKSVVPNSHQIIDAEQSLKIWQKIRDVESFKPPRDIPLWRVIAPTMDMIEIIDSHSPQFYYYDWAGGMMWLSSNRIPTLQNGSFWLIRASQEKREKLPFINEKGPVLDALQKKIKNAFDPKNILNPNRMGF